MNILNEHILYADDLDIWWNGYCPESQLKNKMVKMRLNRNDFFESEETGLQIAFLEGFQAVILNFRGTGEFRTEPVYGHQVKNCETLCPQNCKGYPYNRSAQFFDSKAEIIEYLATLPTRAPRD